VTWPNNVINVGDFYPLINFVTICKIHTKIEWHINLNTLTVFSVNS